MPTLPPSQILYTAAVMVHFITNSPMPSIKVATKAPWGQTLSETFPLLACATMPLNSLPHETVFLISSPLGNSSFHGGSDFNANCIFPL